MALRRKNLYGAGQLHQQVVEKGELVATGHSSHGDEREPVPVTIISDTGVYDGTLNPDDSVTVIHERRYALRDTVTGRTVVFNLGYTQAIMMLEAMKAKGHNQFEMIDMFSDETPPNAA